MNPICLAIVMTALSMSALDAQNKPVFFGTYTKGEGDGKSKGIYRARLDLESGKVTAPELAAAIDNPSYLVMHPSGDRVYAVIEAGKFEGEPGGGVVAFGLDVTSGALSEINRQPVGSKGPAHLAMDSTGRVLIVANYGGGSVSVFPARPDGGLGKRSDFHEHSGSGPNEKRQKAPHAHGITISPDNRFVIVPDLGIDQLKIYRLDSENAKLEPANPPFASLEPGAGPRHFVFSPDGHHGYCVNELDNTLAVFDWDSENGTLTPIQTITTLPKNFDGENTTAAIKVHPSGRFVIASNRGHDSLAVFKRDPNTGKLETVDVVSSGGVQPRDFSISPDGKWLLSAHQSSNSVVVFKLDPASGSLTPTGDALSLGMPVCVLFDD